MANFAEIEKLCCTLGVDVRKWDLNDNSILMAFPRSFVISQDWMNSTDPDDLCEILITVGKASSADIRDIEHAVSFAICQAKNLGISISGDKFDDISGRLASDSAVLRELTSIATELTLKNLVDVFGLPLKVKMPRFYGDFYFLAEKINSRSKKIEGSQYSGRSFYRKKAYNYSEICSLFEEPGVSDTDHDQVNCMFQPTSCSIRPEYVPAKTELLIFYQGEWKRGLFLGFDENHFDTIIKVKIGRQYVDMIYLEEQVKLYEENTFEPQDDQHRHQANMETSVLNEENRYLKKVLDSLSREIGNYRSRLSNHQSAARDTYYDREDLANKQYHIGEANKLESQITDLESYRYSPYFAHMEFDHAQTTSNEPKIETVYIGRKGLVINGPLVIDWRSDFGQTYYMKAMRDFNIKGVPYTLSLRRAIDIKDSVLLGYNTEYDATNVSLEGTIVDPFLLTVLRDKRRQRRLTDIISTIQSNQNNIISQPYKKNFIVQGCAGSGKTMILLHRLSYLLFNNRALSRKNIKIITPNKYFNTFIDNLSEELELHEIERMSVEEYYVRLINAYSAKIKVNPDVSTEINLPNSFLTEVYSGALSEQVTAKFHQYVEDQINKLPLPLLTNMFGKLHQKMPDLSTHKAEPIRALEQELLSLREKNTAVVRNYNTAIKRHSDAQKALEKATEEISVFKTQLSAVTNDLTTQLTEIKSKTLASLDRNELEVRALIDEIGTYTKVNEKTLLDIQSLEATLAQTTEQQQNYFSYDLFVNINTELAQVIRGEHQLLLDEIQTVRLALSKVPIFNFTKRNSLRKKENQLLEQFSSASGASFRLYIQEMQSKLQRLREDESGNPSRMLEIRKRLEELRLQMEKTRQFVLAVEKCLSLFADDNTPNLESDLPAKTLESLREYVGAYISARSYLLRAAQKQQEAKNLVDSCVAQINETEKKLPTDSEVEAINVVLETLTHLDYAEIEEFVLGKTLEELYKKHGVKQTKLQYRFSLYLRLLMCTLFFTKPNIQDSFLNIDEAQDIAISEYKTIHAAVGANCTFNLYGDVNQLVYDYKGINDWEELSSITDNNVFVLNENYRNTMQITTFCNEEFGAEVYPIGVEGEEVQKMRFNAALSWVVNQHKNDSNKRVAVLVSGKQRDEESLRALSEKHNFSWMEVDPKRVSLVTVEMVKGLEFDVVLAIGTEMTENEKYIAYTRALDLLAVAN